MVGPRSESWEIVVRLWWQVTSLSWGEPQTISFRWRCLGVDELILRLTERTFELCCFVQIWKPSYAVEYCRVCLSMCQAPRISCTLRSQSRKRPVDLERHMGAVNAITPKSLWTYIVIHSPRRLPGPRALRIGMCHSPAPYRRGSL